MRILIDNALTHTPEGTAITVRDQIARTAPLRLVVTDDGPGDRPRSRDRVFERFYTGDEVGGSGLGLAIARELARRMDGELQVALAPRPHGVRAAASGGHGRQGDPMSSACRGAVALLATAALWLAACGWRHDDDDDDHHRRPERRRRHDLDRRPDPGARGRGRARELRREGDLRPGVARGGDDHLDPRRVVGQLDPRRRRRSGSGLGFRDLRRRRDPDQRARGHRRETTGRRPRR